MPSMTCMHTGCSYTSIYLHKFLSKIKEPTKQIDNMIGVFTTITTLLENIYRPTDNFGSGKHETFLIDKAE